VVDSNAKSTWKEMLMLLAAAQIAARSMPRILLDITELTIAGGCYLVAELLERSPHPTLCGLGEALRLGCEELHAP
jgi:hypothetical protein